MQNRPIVNNMCEKFHFDRLRNDRSLGNGKSDNNTKKNNALRSDSGLKVDVIIAVMSFSLSEYTKINFGWGRP